MDPHSSNPCCSRIKCIVNPIRTPSPKKPQIPFTYRCLLWAFHRNGIITTCSLRIGLVLISIKFQRLMYTAVCITSFLLMPNSIFCWDITLYIHLSGNGHLGHFYFLAIINTAAMNLQEEVSVWTWFHLSFKYTQGQNCQVIQ